MGTNGLKNVWSLLNRSIMGAYHKVSDKHLGAHLNELGFRFKSPENPDLFRDTMLRLIGSSQLPYKGLVGSKVHADHSHQFPIWTPRVAKILYIAPATPTMAAMNQNSHHRSTILSSVHFESDVTERTS